MIIIKCAFAVIICIYSRLLNVHIHLIYMCCHLYKVFYKSFQTSFNDRLLESTHAQLLLKTMGIVQL